VELRFFEELALSVDLCLTFFSFFSSMSLSQGLAPPPSGPVQTNHATESFNVGLALQPSKDKTGDTSVGRMTFDKQFPGDLEGASPGQMLTATTSVKGSAGYLAIERVRGTLRGRFRHVALPAHWHPGAQRASIVTKAPDSGTIQLIGLGGAISITAPDGKHSYDFSSSLPNLPSMC
jgi:hypothetical protein